MSRKNALEALQEQKLKELIATVNMIPPDLTLLDFSDALLWVESESPEGTDFDRYTKALNACLDGWKEEDRTPRSFREYVWGLPDSQWRDAVSVLNEAVARYINFLTALRKLYGVANINRLRPGKLKEFKKFLDSLGGGTRTEIDDGGRLRFVKDWFGEAAEGIDPTLIRHCKNCEYVFFATRKDQSCCTTRCANLSRQHNKRYDTEEKREAYKLNRHEREKNINRSPKNSNSNNGL
jgi:hypothetical protein